VAVAAPAPTHVFSEEELNKMALCKTVTTNLIIIFMSGSNLLPFKMMLQSSVEEE
jgi:hypothetical protein